jgi:fatty acid desaturase
MSAILTLPPHPTLNSPTFQKRVNQLRTIDNVTNWFYLIREYVLLGLVVALTIGFYITRESWGLSWFWNVPVSLFAIVIIGAFQHRLTNLAHEGSHYMLFRNRWLNEFVSDWFCLYPMWSTTHQYRLQHLAHHQYVNDPERDPDVTQMTASGHKYEFPMMPGRFVWEVVVKQFLWLPKLVRYIRVRAKYSSTGSGSGPYVSKGPRKNKLLILGGVGYLASLAATLTGLVMLGDPLWLFIVPVVMWAAIMGFYAWAPEEMFLKSLLKPDLSPRTTAFLRITYLSLVFNSLAWLTYLTGYPWAVWYGVLWLVPLFTTFSFFMILRQVVQHGNAGSDRLTNTRIFHVHRLIQLAVFPLGMDYHLPHHLFPMVPHFRLRQLHALLLECQEYRQQATVVEGYFFPRERPPQHPTVVDLMATERETH